MHLKHGVSCMHLNNASSMHQKCGALSMHLKHYALSLHWKHIKQQNTFKPSEQGDEPEQCSAIQSSSVHRAVAGEACLTQHLLCKLQSQLYAGARCQHCNLHLWDSEVRRDLLPRA